MNPVVAHLNSGPLDDELVVLPPGRELYFVRKPAPMMALSQFLEEARPDVFSTTGTYEVRRDGFNQMVPHDLESVEFDWKGWDC